MSDLVMYGDVGWDISAAQVNRDLNAAAPGPLTVRINSAGGSVFDGLAIASMLRRRGDVTAIVDGLAASAASIILIGASRRVMAPGTMVMIHNPWSMVAGGADDIRKEADVLDTIAGSMAKLYAESSGGKLDEKEAARLMDEETWLTAEQAVELGLVHAVEGSAHAMAKIDKSRHAYRNIPGGISMSTETAPPVTEPEAPSPSASLLDRILSKFSPAPDQSFELATARAELSEASAALVDAAAKINDLSTQIETMKAEHAAALETAKAEARIEGEQSATAQMLKDNGPEPLPHQEEVEGAPSTHTAKWNALRAAGKHAEAGEYYSKHKSAIFQGA